MHNFLPVVVIGGPPHAGKSVLFYSLTQALHERNIPHHILRACPDGEGNWSQESSQEVATLYRDKLQGPWPNGYIDHVARSLQHRCLPMLVDMGGRPQGNQASTILSQCTHTILLTREDEPESTELWKQLVNENGLQTLALLDSRLDGEPRLVQSEPTITGTITNLKRYGGHRAQGSVFDALVDRIADLFLTCTPQDLEQVLLDQASGELIDVSTPLRGADRWLPEMVPQLVEQIDSDADTLSVYGRGPNWLYATLATVQGIRHFYQYDPRFGRGRETRPLDVDAELNLPPGWVEPARVEIGTKQRPDYRVTLQEVPYADNMVTVLTSHFSQHYLDYFSVEPFAFPAVPANHGLILNGPYPHWLLTALVRLYRDQGISWIGVFQVPLNCSVVTYSRRANYEPGMRIDVPFSVTRTRPPRRQPPTRGEHRDISSLALC